MKNYYKEFLEECKKVCRGWGRCSWAEANPNSCPLTNGEWGLYDEEDMYIERNEE